jgi:hypothetical protein
LTKTVNIIGGKGNMGERYTAILKYLGYQVVSTDLDTTKEAREAMARFADCFIVATPTENHLKDVADLFEYQKPILCEKPLGKKMHLIEEFEDRYRPDLTLLSVINQYKYLDLSTAKGHTYWNYFRSGKDGLALDCVSLFAVARGIVRLNNTSPIWTAVLNGRKLNLAMMDGAYLELMEDWLTNPVSNYAFYRKGHEKALEWMELNK